MKVFGKGFVQFAIIVAVVAHSELFTANIADLCLNRCRIQNFTDVSHCEDFVTCSQQCEEGCKLWKQALLTSCQEVCNVTVMSILPEEVYCTIGCNDAIALYDHQLKAKLGKLPPPALVADSLTATSLRLEWHFPHAKESGLKYFLQYEERDDAWQYCRNQSWGSHDTVFVDNLEPYTKYRFRVVLILTTRTEHIVSPPSVVISTLAAGVPASPPSKVRAVPVDSTRITVSWEPGPFPHGPILSYVLQITDRQGHSALKDLPADTKFFMCKNLNPNSNYTVSISMRNSVGPGPPALVNVATPQESQDKQSEKPILILASNHVIIEQGTDMLDEPNVLYTTKAQIKGVAIHVAKKMLFVSDSDKSIHRMSLDANHTTNTEILSAAQLDFFPLDMSMDWLNEHLYILGEVYRVDGSRVWQVARCNLTGGDLMIALAGLLKKPHHFEVDPYNGYLFWGTSSGIFRLDLGDISNGIKREVQPYKVTSEKNLGAFTVDHKDFRLLVSNQNKNTVLSVSFDGKEMFNIRQKITTSRFEKVISIVAANDILYWTNGQEVFFEEHPPDNTLYYHNSYPLTFSHTYTKVLVNLTSSQSTPIPLNPPINVQAVFGKTTARITWDPPHILAFQGKGAWRNWSYDISIKDLTTHNTCFVRDINSTSHLIEGLNEDTEYVIKTLAYTKSGTGPWSSEFVGRTLKATQDNLVPSILWSSVDGLLKSDVTGDNVQTILHSTSIIGANFTDIAWYRDTLYLVTNTSQLIWYRISTKQYGMLSDVDSVRSVVVDWIGEKLYWCNPKQQMIIRGNMNGTQKEHIKLNTLAKELHVDSLNGYLYWSTGHTLESSRLNGAEHYIYHESQMFSGRHVMGLSLDTNNKHIYWIVRGLDRSDLFRAPTAGTVANPLNEVVEFKLRVSNLTGPLCYFNNRLIWLQDDKSAMISDLEGKYTASISGKGLQNLNTVYVMDSSLHSGTGLNLSVIPVSVDPNSIKIVGMWNSFNITWGAVKNVNYGRVFYEIKVDTPLLNDSSITTIHPTIKYWRQITPYTKIHITLRAFTYWGNSAHTKLKTHSPSAIPDLPTNPRAFSVHNNISANVTFRWKAPNIRNGVLEGYRIRWMSQDNPAVSNSQIVDDCNEEYVVKNLAIGNYSFEVCAVNDAGEGNFSEIVVVDTSKPKPIPTVIVASDEAVLIKDLDLSDNYTILRGNNVNARKIGYLFSEGKVFFINNKQELMMVNLAGTNLSRMVEVVGSLIDLTVDWLQRSIYYVLAQGNISNIYKLDLNLYERGIVKNIKVLEVENAVLKKLEISPFLNKLYWMQYSGEKTSSDIFQSNSDGTNPENYFSKNCDCPKVYQQTFTLNLSEMDNKLLYFDESGNIFESSNRCNCRLLAKNNLGNITSLSTDFNYMYWSNGHLLTSRNLTKPRKISNNDMKIFGQYYQPHPEINCLKPVYDSRTTVSLVKRTGTSLTLSMPSYKSLCNASMPTVEYVIYYMSYDSTTEDLQCDNACTQKTTFDPITDIINLKPFSKYVFCVALTNYFTSQNHDKVFIGPGVVFQTEAGAPTPPKNPKVFKINPTLLKVTWDPPEFLNGDFVNYEVHWQTEGTISGIRHKGEQTVILNDQIGDLSTQLANFTPNETYTIWVRAYSENNEETSSDSEHISVTTYPEPNELVLAERSASELRILWNVSENINEYKIQWSPLTANDWNSNLRIQVTDFTASAVLSALKPKTLYKFRLSLKYPLGLNEYIWPNDARFSFETLGDRPTPPGIPIIQHMKSNLYQVWWEASRDNGAPIIMYNLEALKSRAYRTKRNAQNNRTAWFHTAPSIDEPEFIWESIYNGTDTFWLIDDLSTEYRYSFRVSASNSYGWSDFSEESIQFDLLAAAQMAEKPDLFYLLAAIIVPLAILAILLICCKLCSMWCRRTKKEIPAKIGRGLDVELATLRELPRRGNFLQNTNILYIANQMISEDITMLPHISRNHITLVRFLGSGAFGEVFQGKAKGLNDCQEETKVAVKTLRKGASDQEKTEFLQEAQLMSHFKHEHILQLLGVCLDNDPHFIIMELMEGGDLLTYLRSSRKAELQEFSLNLLDLLKMCLDVAKGCKYLEEMHFVHRDLACRNCLVSSTDPQLRIVKIGDFGLARDIYKNDYYRKEGQGLLPVRWMSPESLVDGVFTSQSDVWAFGVLLWEIMTLGQQPYPARSNIEVLHYVRCGGRLGKPTDCPESLHELMLSCWKTEAELRPTFKYCLEILEQLHVETTSGPVTGAHFGQYVSTVPDDLDGINNRAYFEDFIHNNNNHSGSSWKTIGSDTSREQVPFLPNTAPETIPTYLELLHDENDRPVENDGYEVPRTVIEESDAFEQVVNELTNIEQLLKDNQCDNVEYTNMQSGDETLNGGET